MKLEVIIASTRPGRLGRQIGDWFVDYASKNSDFDVAMADLAEINLPMFDEPNHPRLGQYMMDHTKAWSARIVAADAFVIVTPEYNYSMPPALVNAMDYLSKEWGYKPVGFVGYGGLGAARAIQMEKQLVTALGMMPLPVGVSLTGVHAPAVQEFSAEHAHGTAAGLMLTELKKWAEALRPLHS
jgi:NAD(P)H-dependent FMN reductase